MIYDDFIHSKPDMWDKKWSFLVYFAIQTMKVNMQKQVEDLVTEVQSAESYITTYAAGNTLSADFYS